MFRSPEPVRKSSLGFWIVFGIFVAIFVISIFGLPLWGWYIHQTNMLQHLSPSREEYARIERRRTLVAKEFGLRRSQVEVYHLGISNTYYVVLHLAPKDIRQPSGFSVETPSGDELKRQTELILEHRPEPDFGPLVVPDTLLRHQWDRLPYDSKRHLAMMVHWGNNGDGPQLPF